MVIYIAGNDIFTKIDEMKNPRKYREMSQKGFVEICDIWNSYVLHGISICIAGYIMYAEERRYAFVILDSRDSTSRPESLNSVMNSDVADTDGLN